MTLFMIPIFMIFQESVPLYGINEEPSLKAIVRGDSMLFFLKIKVWLLTCH